LYIAATFFILKISIIGSGNIATYFATSFYNAGCTIHQIVSEKVNRASALAAKVNAQVVVDLLGLDPDIDALIIAIPDDDIKKLQLKMDTTVIHCSGTNSLQSIAMFSKNIGCIWPIYSITKHHLPTIPNIPIVINYNNDSSKKTIEYLANILSTSVTVLQDDQKQIAHLTATITNNFSNHLFTIGQHICSQHQIPFSLLIPILELTIQKLNTSLPSQNQTGPALRGDDGTMHTHYQLLKFDADLQQLYQLMSKLIQTYHTNKQ
jgi:predicted short-subunit dehydrogenase-like oxidoreductase (DUF2520 family)